MPTPKKAEMPSDVEMLTIQVHTLATNIADEKDAQRRGNRARNISLAILLVLCLLLGWGYHKIIEARTDGRIAACQVDHNFATKHNKLVKSVENMVTVVFHTVTTNASPENKAGAEKLIALLNGPIDLNVVPVRKCDPASIAAFNKNKGAE